MTRLLHFVVSKNLPYSNDDIRTFCKSCPTCAKMMSQFYKPPSGQLIKAMHPMERLCIDFTGPITQSQYPYFLNVVDEYSRFPFAFACTDMKIITVIKCLEHIFTFCGMSHYIHSDRGQSFMSSELKQYLTQKVIATSKSAPYHSTRNVQCDSFNQTIWNCISLYLESNKMSLKSWNLAINALHSIRSLLCTSTIATPHEWFFIFKRKSTNGTSLPTWLMSPGKVYLRKFVRDKIDPLLDEVELLDSNQHDATIKHSDGKESTVSTKDLAPCHPQLPKEGTTVKDGDSVPIIESLTNLENLPPSKGRSSPTKIYIVQNKTEEPALNSSSVRNPVAETIQEKLPEAQPVLRRSSRQSESPLRLFEV